MQQIARRTFLITLMLLGGVMPCRAWGDEGHMIIATVAQRFLEPGTQNQIDALLNSDSSGLTAPDFAHQATWADKYRDSDRNTTRQRYQATEQWHYVDIELDRPDIDLACFGHPLLPPQSLASEGPQRACIVDKIDQFAKELTNPATPQPEKLLALKFILHLVGDIHQPLHAADDHDRGGNGKSVTLDGRPPCTRLHAYWDTTLVRKFGPGANRIADDLIRQFGTSRTAWQGGGPTDWALESFQLARDVVYKLPVTTDLRGQCSTLTTEYESRALATAREQLFKAGIRLGAMLNQALR
jgi:hypothetical protein